MMIAKRAVGMTTLKSSAKKTLLLRCLVVCSTLFTANIFAGFAADTLVKTEQSFVPIKQAIVPRKVACIRADGISTLQKIIATHIKREQQFVVIVLDDDEIITTPDQKLYSPIHEIFKKVEDLKSGDLLLTYSGKCVAIRDIRSVTQEKELFDITVAECHNFFVSRSEVLVHNFVPIISISWALGGGLSYTLPALGACIWGAILGKIMHRKQRREYDINFQQDATLLKQENNQQNNPNATSQSPSNQPSPNNSNPNDPDNNDPDKNNQDTEHRKSEVKISELDAKHMFRNKSGHIPDTPENRKLLIDVASDAKNFLGPDKHNNQWYGKIDARGQQVWAETRGNIIWNGGINKVPQSYNPITGLCRLRVR